MTTARAQWPNSQPWFPQHCFSPRFLCRILIVGCLVGFLLPQTATAQRLPRDQGKNGSALKKAFREVVAGPTHWTAQIEIDKKPVALGVVVDADGWILTKASQMTGELVCRLHDGRRLPAEIIGVRQDYDLAMLKIDAQELPVVEWRSENDLQVGQWLASPGMGELPVAVGVVSAGRRAITREPGQLGFSFAETETGPKITHVFPNSGADKAGLKAGDIITQAAGIVVRNGSALKYGLQKFGPGDSLALHILRGEQELDIIATFGYRLTNLFDRSALMNRMGSELSLRRSGFPACIQHDSIIRPQECGGAVVGLDGKAAGINIARSGRTESQMIPASDIIPLLDDLKSGRHPAPFVATERPSKPSSTATAEAQTEETMPVDDSAM